MNTTIHLKKALQHYRDAFQNWLSLRNEQSTAQLRLQALLLSADKASNYAWQVETLREKLEVLEWQISCEANDSLYAQRSVGDACVDIALSDFMANSGKALTSALAPYLNGPFGLDVAARVLRSSLAHYSELNAPELLESCRDILDESGLSPDASMRMDASRRFTPAKHIKAQAPETNGGSLWLYSVLSVAQSHKPVPAFMRPRP